MSPPAPQQPDLFLISSPAETAPPYNSYGRPPSPLTIVPYPAYQGQRSIIARSLDRMLADLERPPHIAKLIMPITQVELPQGDIISILSLIFDEHALFDAARKFITNLRVPLAWEGKKLVVHLNEEGELAISMDATIPALNQLRYRSGDLSAITAVSKELNRILRCSYRFLNGGSPGEHVYRCACEMLTKLEAAHDDCRCSLDQLAAVYQDMRSIFVYDSLTDAQRLALLIPLKRRLAGLSL